MTLLHADLCEVSKRQKSKMADGRRCWVMGMMGFAIQMATGCSLLHASHCEQRTSRMQLGSATGRDVGGEYICWACAKEDVSQCASLNPGW